MMNRTPTKVLPNGAIRYGVYDEAGNFLRYEYIKPEDEPTQEGTPFCMATMLKVATAALYGKDSSAVPDDIFAAIKSLVDDAKNEAILKKPVTGSYLGNAVSGSLTQQINLGFEPLCVIVASKSDSISNGVLSTALYGIPSDGVTINSSGFVVSGSVNGNAVSGGSGEKAQNPYRYIAFKK